MGRRKNDNYDQGTFSSDDDDSYRERLRHEMEDEASLFQDPNKRRRGMTKEQAIYGYDWDSDDDSNNNRAQRPRRSGVKTDISHFVSASSKPPSSKEQDEEDSDHAGHGSESSADEKDNNAEEDDDQSMRSDSGSDRSMSSNEDQNDEDDEDAEARREREAAFKAARQREREENDAWEDSHGGLNMMSSSMGMRPGLGNGQPTMETTPAPSATTTTATPTATSAKDPQPPTSNKSMAETFRKSLGLSAGSSSPTTTSPSTSSQRSRSRANNSLGAFMNRNNISRSNEPSPSPGPSSPRPSSPALHSKPSKDGEHGEQQQPTIAAKAIKVSRDFGAFSKQGSGIGLKLLKQMGWKEGYGLGAGGSGIVEPIQSKLRPTKMGLGFNGFREKSAQDRAEEKRRGYAESEEDEDEGEGASKRGKSKKGEKKAQRDEAEAALPKADGWKRKPGREGKRKGPRIEYKTAEEIQREIESSDQPMTAATAPTQKILDMTGKQVRELTSASQISSLHGSMIEGERFPELRYNLDLMASLSTTDLEQVARRQKEDHARAQVLECESQMAQDRIAKDVLEMDKLVKAMTISDQCITIAEDLRQSSTNTTGTTAVDITEEQLVAAFREPFDLLAGLYFEEYQRYSLDQVVVAVLQESVKALFAHWDVLKNPRLGSTLFGQWKKLLKQSKVVYANSMAGMETDDYDYPSPRHGRGGGGYGGPERMTAYESLLYQTWLPKVRSAINNEWQPRDCDPMVELLEAWAPPVLPKFLQDNVITQLILPKLRQEVATWSPRDPLLIHTWIHPWLPILGEVRMEQELFGDIRRKFAAGLTSWQVLDPSALQALAPWRGVWDPTDMELLLLKSVLPKLIEGLQAFEINPRAQKLDVLRAVLPWHTFFPSTTFSALLQNEFFPRWHHVLYLWLTHPSTTDLDQVSQWYLWWKDLFPPALLHDTGVTAGFRKGLDMINQLMAGLKVMPPAEPQRISYGPGSSGGDKQGPSATSKSRQHQQDTLGRLQANKHLVAASSISFKDLVQDYAAQNSLLLVLTSKMHEGTGRPLYRLGGNSTGTSGGVLVHLTDEVAFIKSEEAGGAWVPISIEDLMVLAGGKGKAAAAGMR
ncbi:hypothetical protein DFQ27_005251 [Actinomortierella ambigua]|uniref:G-patch domain-containing protein n=1 Tax=Actinomortierella ambigua TaxID=1343610 RepID=A0A9P6Q155_9FUNG|nr:hypothetical protein DFQ27_005251 [Actinomortierella ambigua]